MLGMNARTGAPLDGDDHLRQSIVDILVTPIGSRVMRRDYGSALFDLIDQPGNALTKLRLTAAIAMALMRWEPRITLKRIDVRRGEIDGQWILELETLRRDAIPASATERMSLPLRFKAAAPPTVRPAYA